MLHSSKIAECFRRRVKGGQVAALRKRIGCHLNERVPMTGDAPTDLGYADGDAYCCRTCFWFLLSQALFKAKLDLSNLEKITVVERVLLLWLED
ncbi:MAG TPA: hypothetical protein VEI53_07480, partial [Ktedonobacteraceae bacterium]|nr:hypothetical protein [Ktedonobacteraceae bacterium]